MCKRFLRKKLCRTHNSHAGGSEAIFAQPPNGRQSRFCYTEFTRFTELDSRAIASDSECITGRDTERSSLMKKFLLP